jgi:hypothetical protein
VPLLEVLDRAVKWASNTSMTSARRTCSAVAQAMRRRGAGHDAFQRPELASADLH